MGGVSRKVAVITFPGSNVTMIACMFSVMF